MAAAPCPAVAQQIVSVSGQIYHGTARDSTLLPNQWVVLHAIGNEGGAPVDSVRTDARGGYHLSAAVKDTSAVYLVSTRYDAITYFSQPLASRNEHTVPAIVVYDTSSVAPPIEVAQRHIVVRLPGKDGTRRVLELLVLQNSGGLTRIATDSLHPIWAERLPEDAIQVQIGDGDVSDASVNVSRDSIAVTAPVPPGQKQLLFTYVLPSNERELDVTMVQPVTDLNLMLEDTTATLVSGPVVPRGKQVFEDAHFARFEGTDVPAGSRVVVRFAAPMFTPTEMVVALVVLVGIGLVGGLTYWLRRNAGAVVTPELLAEQIARLDEAYEARGVKDPAAEAAYRAQRGALKGRLEAALAARQPRR